MKTNMSKRPPKRRKEFDMMAGKSLPLSLLPLATEADPWWFSIKYDGIQCRTWDRVLCKSNTLEVVTSVQTKSGKPIPNHHIRRILEALPRGFQGELVSGNFQQTTSAVMGREGEPEFKFRVFNYFSCGNLSYCEKRLDERLQDAQFIIDELGLNYCVEIVEYEPVFTIEEVNRKTEEVCGVGVDGAMITLPSAPYWWGYCSKTAPYSIKVKPFEDAEWEILELLPEIYGPTETNEALGVVGQAKDKLGRMCFGPGNDFTDGFTAAVSFTDEEAEEMWKQRDSYVGRIATVKYLATGCKDSPRHPNVIKIRHLDEV